MLIVGFERMGVGSVGFWDYAVAFKRWLSVFGRAGIQHTAGLLIKEEGKVATR